jgi:hypothetical protein
LAKEVGSGEGVSGACLASEWPHALQNLLRAGFFCPHCGQTSFDLSSVPQLLQNLTPLTLSYPHFGHFISTTLPSITVYDPWQGMSSTSHASDSAIRSHSVVCSYHKASTGMNMARCVGLPFRSLTYSGFVDTPLYSPEGFDRVPCQQIVTRIKGHFLSSFSVAA